MIRISISILLFILLSGCVEQEYPSGRDTYKSFGNGRFQILRGERLSLMDSVDGGVVLSPVRDFRFSKGVLFAVGSYDLPVSYVVIAVGSEKVYRYDKLDAVANDRWRETLSRLKVK